MLAVILGQTAFAQVPASPAVSAAASATPTVKLLFSSLQDVFDTWGQLQISVTPVGLIRPCEPPEFAVAGCIPQENGTWEVFGQQLTPVSRGKNPYDEINSWTLIRAITRDGEKYENVETVIDQPAAAWTQHMAVAYNPIAKEYLLLKLKADSYGFAYTAFFSSDGKHWQPYEKNPLFYDGDAMSLFWSPVLKRFVCINKSLQPYRKHIRDHGGTTRTLNDEALRDRRVLMMRSSPDGRRWEPSVTLPDVWDRHGQKGSLPPGFLTVPDSQDPPDLEFYSGNAFWYHDRACMMVLNYAASTLTTGKHAPHLDNEWWTSVDGLRWERPTRGLNALDVFPEVIRLESSPLVANGMILFPRGKMLLGMPEDRISGISARTNGEFSTRSFKMPAADLQLNAAIPSLDRPFAKPQAYVTVALLDEKGAVIPGFEAEKCALSNINRRDIPLKWGDKSARELAGKTVRLRFMIRGATIFAVASNSVSK